MFEKIITLFKKMIGAEQKQDKSKDTAKERLHLVLMQDRANVSADFLELMKQEIIDVIKKYIDIDENAIDVRLTNKTNEDGTTGAPALYANIPITNVKTEITKTVPELKEDTKVEQEKEPEEEKPEEQKRIEEQEVVNNEIEGELEQNIETEQKVEETVVPEEKIEEANRIIHNTSEDKQE